MPLRTAGFPNSRPPNGFGFDRHGPTLGGVQLLDETPIGFRVRPISALENMLQSAFEIHFDCADLTCGLEVVCRALNANDLAKAAIATQFLRSPRTRLDRPPVTKASADDPIRPGWPKGTPDSKGGKFRPKTADGTYEVREGDAPDGSQVPLTTETKKTKIESLQARKTLRSILRRVLTAKRVARMIGEIFGDIVPGLDELTGPATIMDDLQLARDISDDIAGSDAAIKFAENGPRSLKDLRVDDAERSFTSYSAFQKIDLEKIYGPAEPGYDFHHIVEQSTKFGSDKLQSTSNIVKIPKLLHEKINSIYSSTDVFGPQGTKMTLRNYLKDKSFDENRSWGLKIMRKVGVLR